MPRVLLPPPRCQDEVMDEGRIVDDLSLLLGAWTVVVVEAIVLVQVEKTRKHERQDVGEEELEWWHHYGAST